MPATRQQSMFVTVAGETVFATQGQEANGNFVHHQAQIRKFLDDTDLEGPFRCRFYEGSRPPRDGQPLEAVDGTEWTWKDVR